MKNIKQQFYKFSLLLLTALLVFSSMFMVGAYWANQVFINYPNQNQLNTITIGTWETNYVTNWNDAPDDYIFKVGDLVVYVEDGVEYHFIIRKDFKKSDYPRPIHGLKKTITLYTPADSVVWDYGYSYWFGDVVYHEGTYYISRTTTLTRHNPNAANEYTPSSYNSYWRAVQNYSSTTQYEYVRPANTEAGTLGNIYLVRYNNELYRVIKTPPIGTLPTNTEYFEHLDPDNPVDFIHH